MKYSSSLTDNLTPVVLDTSVLINLHASKQGGRILGHFPNPILVPEIVAAELEHDTSKTQGHDRFVQELIADLKVRAAVMGEPEYQVFSRLVSGSPSLGDGEAATIAIASVRIFVPIIDERKGRLQAQSNCFGNGAAWSLDLFRHPTVVAGLGPALASDALYLALRDGRMRIHEDHCDYVVSLIGVEHALECRSLPRYKERQDLWRKKLDSGT